jgi:aminoglycoside phosphotransferase (APT) family kinase protein
MRDELERWLQERRDDDVTIGELRRIATGNSRAMWFVAMSDATRYVVRVEQGGVFGTASSDEFAMMQAAHTLGCRVAPVRWLETAGDVIGRPFFVMDFVDGAETGRDDRSMSTELAIDFVRHLSELHRTDWASALGPPGDPAQATHAQIDRWHRTYLGATGDIAIPLLEEGAAWLHHHALPVERPGIVHGDPGPGNVVHDGQRVVAFTDWEFAHVGDPMEDWVYLVTMRGNRTMPPGDWLALFREVAGVEVTERDLHYWSVFNHFKGACANATCRRVFATTNPAPNMGIIGTALHQTYVRRVAALIGGDA